MNYKDFNKQCYTHETILRNVVYDENKKELTFYLDYCEWQLEECNFKQKGYILKFYGVENVTDKSILRCKNQFIVAINLKKLSAYLSVEDDEYVDIEFNYKNFEVEFIDAN